MHPARYVFGSDGTCCALSVELLFTFTMSVRYCESNRRYYALASRDLVCPTNCWNRLEHGSRVFVWITKVTVPFPSAKTP